MDTENMTLKKNDMRIAILEAEVGIYKAKFKILEDLKEILTDSQQGLAYTGLNTFRVTSNFLEAIIRTSVNNCNNDTIVAEVNDTIDEYETALRTVYEDYLRLLKSAVALVENSDLFDGNTHESEGIDMNTDAMTSDKKIAMLEAEVAIYKPKYDRLRFSKEMKKLEEMLTASNVDLRKSNLKALSIALNHLGKRGQEAADACNDNETIYKINESIKTQEQAIELVFKHYIVLLNVTVALTK